MRTSKQQILLVTTILTQVNRETWRPEVSLLNIYSYSYCLEDPHEKHSLMTEASVCKYLYYHHRSRHGLCLFKVLASGKAVSLIFIPAWLEDHQKYQYSIAYDEIISMMYQFYSLCHDGSLIKVHCIISFCCGDSSVIASSLDYQSELGWWSKSPACQIGVNK